ncbi:MAG: hypothetical protein A2V78_05185 [Betaproteobacteria bacterium RBG_16_64_18]|nr:MAG: hypothetical protein A2V78_05185 [Betaproteobacteria bacterium RBG_16_64_18]
MIETIIDALSRQARERPAAPALADGRERLNWGEVKAWVARAAGWLRSCGLARGAPVLGWLPNRVEWYLLRLACEQAGLFWIPVPASQGKRELASIAGRVRPAVLATGTVFRDRDFDAMADEICREHAIAPLRITLPKDGLLCLEGPVDDGRAALRPEEPAHALATTGTEGIPKLAVFSLAAACERAHAQARLLRLVPEDILLTLSPGVGPARAAWLAAPVAGSCVLGLPAFGTDAAIEMIERERPTVVCGTPTQLAILAAGLDRADFTSVRFWYTAGSVMPSTLAEDLERGTRGIVLSTYGGADFGGWAAPSPDDPAAVRRGTVGRPRGGTEFRIVDAEGRVLPRGTAGELIGRGPCCADGYFGGEGNESWRDGWFHTGDLAVFDGEGNIVIVGRLKEVINRGGDNVSPSEVEALLRTLPGVTQVAVIGVPDPVLGERVCACVVPAPGSNIQLAALRDRLGSQGMAHFKLPEQLVLLDCLPVIGDKTDRRALAALASSKSKNGGSGVKVVSMQG